MFVLKCRSEMYTFIVTFGNWYVLPKQTQLCSRTINPCEIHIEFRRHCHSIAYGILLRVVVYSHLFGYTPYETIKKREKRDENKMLSSKNKVRLFTHLS